MKRCCNGALPTWHSSPLAMPIGSRHWTGGLAGPEESVGIDNKPLLVLNPVSDKGFVDRARALLHDHPTAADFQAALREYYPSAIVRRRDLADERDTWYVYRDGRWTPPSQATGG